MPTLFIVATPLGNLEDFSPRALRVLRECELIACEDTRRTGRLLAHFGLETPMVSFHDHNEVARSESILAALREGKRVALVSDAGTPLISDPGYLLVRHCREEGVSVIPVPGPCAAIAALSAAGLPTDHFFFAGFPARKASALRKQLVDLSQIEGSLIFYLSPHRLGPTLAEFVRVFPNRQACLFREMTKLHETSRFGTMEEVAKAIGEETPRGEYTLVLEGCRGAKEKAPAGLDVAAYVTGLETLRGLSRSEAIKTAVHQLGLSRRQVYNSLIDRRESD